MDKKKLIYIVGGIAVIGLVYYFYNKNKKPIGAGANPNAPTEQPETEEATKGTEKTAKSLADAKAKPKPVKKNFGTPTKGDGKKYMTVCGKRPLIKKNRPMWEACVNEQKAKGGSAFDGASNYFEIQSNISGNVTDNMDIF